MDLKRMLYFGQTLRLCHAFKRHNKPTIQGKNLRIIDNMNRTITKVCQKSLEHDDDDQVGIMMN